MIQPIVLAAGLGSRMGVNKALLPVGDLPALAVVLRTIEAAGLTSPIIVLGHNAEAVRNAVNLKHGCVIVNPHPEKGMSHSLGMGLDASPADATGVLVFHVDMPFVASATVRAVANEARRGAILAAPVHEETRGFPVFFAQAVIASLKASLQGDIGGRTFIRSHDRDLTCVTVNDPGCVFDIDTPSDLGAWKGEPLCATKE